MHIFHIRHAVFELCMKQKEERKKEEQQQQLLTTAKSRSNFHIQFY